MRLPAAAGAEGSVVAARRSRAPAPRTRDLAATSTRSPRTTTPRTGIGRPLLIGGALTSAALSLAGAAYVAWRLSRPPASPMARAVRAVARTRLA